MVAWCRQVAKERRDASSALLGISMAQTLAIVKSTEKSTSSGGACRSKRRHRWGSPDKSEVAGASHAGANRIGTTPIHANGPHLPFANRSFNEFVPCFPGRSHNNLHHFLWAYGVSFLFDGRKRRSRLIAKTRDAAMQRHASLKDYNSGPGRRWSGGNG